MAGCGSSAPTRLARKQVAHVDRKEAVDPHRLLGGLMVFRVQTLQFGPQGWSVEGSVVNRTKQAVRIVFAHEAAGHNAFGLYAFESNGFLNETHAHPPVPELLLPGDSWSGTFSGPDRIARGARIHVQFGQFAPDSGGRFLFITDHTYLVR
jgi:hypothetical protein